MLSSLVDFYAEKFGFVSARFSKRFLSSLQKDLLQARLGFAATKYAAFCFGLSLTLAFLSFLATSKGLATVFPLFLLIFSASFFAFRAIPITRKKRTARQLEKQLPAALRTIATGLSINASFETCLQSLADQPTAIGREFKKVLADVQNGASVPESLNSLAERTDSRQVRHAVAQLVSAYQKGGTKKAAGALKKISDEQNSALVARMKEFNGKLVVYSLLFIVVSAVIPAMFQTFMIVGSSFLSLGFTPQQALLIPITVFPLASILVFLAVNMRRP